MEPSETPIPSGVVHRRVLGEPITTKSLRKDDFGNRNDGDYESQIYGAFQPPNGLNNVPQSPTPFSDWGYLPPPKGSEIYAYDGKLNIAYAPKVLLMSVGYMPERAIHRTLGQAEVHDPTQSTELQPDSGEVQPVIVSSDSPPLLPESRDLVVLGPYNRGAPYKNWEDSRKNYPMEGLFPRPERGWTHDEQDDFKQSVLDHWKGYPYSDSQKISLADTLWNMREQNKRDYVDQYKMPPFMYVDMSPSFAGILSNDWLKGPGKLIYGDRPPFVFSKLGTGVCSVTQPKVGDASPQPAKIEIVFLD